jgi:hypothetical protein
MFAVERNIDRVVYAKPGDPALADHVRREAVKFADELKRAA